MRQIHDRRFEKGDWPIRFVIDDPRHADNWLKYLSSECTARGWNSGGIAQVNATENSGSQTVRMGAAGAESEYVIERERKRKGPLVLHAPSVGEIPLALAQGLL